MEGIQFDSDLLFNEKKFGVPSLAMTFPLYAGIATPEQAKRTKNYISEHFQKPGGWVTTNQNTGQQWDAPNGWTPLQWITYKALKKYGANELANEGAKRWLTLNGPNSHSATLAKHIVDVSES